ncbi:MAG: discoidin domain-containing protein [Thermoproteota archaeon]|nr:discoidin domain-containing protein [Thermoproteota archaeon]
MLTRRLYAPVTNKTKKVHVKKTFGSISLMILLALSLGPLIFSLKSTNAQSNNDMCEKLPVVEIGANGQRGVDTAEFAVDGDPDSRWANQEIGSFVQLDLGIKNVICEIDIAWFRGDDRSYNFAISTSNDGAKFKDIVTASSTGKTGSLERYNIPDQVARFVRVTVFGNTQNDLGSINEMAIQGQSCNSPKIIGISTTGDDGHLSQNTLDNSLNTRWSSFGLPSSIQYDLGRSQPICDIDIAWYRGNLRVNSFTISASQDGQSFVPLFVGQSTGKTFLPERYDVADTIARFLRITVTSNTEINWASISEVGINKKSPSYDLPSDSTPDLPSDSTPGDQSDPFGIEKIYPTKSGGEEWFMDMTDGQDSRSRPPSMEKNSDGSFKVESSQVRYGVFTSAGYNPDEIELDHGVLAERGYMQSPQDWRDVEMTGYVKVNSGDSGENFAWYARGGRHTGSGNPEGCEGSAYKPGLFYDGRVRFSKEQWHVSYDFTDHKEAMSSIEDRWVGFKGIMWNDEEQNGETVVRMEIWVDNNEDGNEDGPWVKVDENTDSGGWGDTGEECGGEPDQIITWGGPIATFRWDGASDVDIKNFSVREIQPPTQ